MRQLAWRWLALAALVWAGPWSSTAPAQDAAAPPEAAAPANPAVGFGNSAQAKLSGVPVATVVEMAVWSVLVLIWIATGDWVNQDSQIFGLGYKKWNPVVFFPFAVASLALAFVPVKPVVRLPALAVVYLASIIPYVIVHNRHVLPHQTVLTGSWWRHFFASMLGKVGVKVSGERKAEYEKGAAVDLIAMGGPGPNEDNANLITARQSPGYLLVKDLIADMVIRRSDRALLEYGPEAVAVRHEIDGVWHNGDARDRESGDVMLAVMKTLANLDAKERRRKQEGKFGAVFEGNKYMCPS